MDTQRRWSNLSVTRTDPILLDLASWTTLATYALQKHRHITQRTTSWYEKPSPTFVDAIASERRHLWLPSEDFSRWAGNPGTQQFPVALYHRMVDFLA